MKKTLLLALCTMMIFSVALYGCMPQETDGTAQNTEETGTQSPGASVPETAEPETAEPEITEPETTEPETDEPDIVIPATDLSGSLEEIYEGILAQSTVDTGMTFKEMVTVGLAQSYTGLTAEQMEEYVEEALAVNALINVNAHLVVLLRCVDDAAAMEVKTLIASGFDSGRWICVIPERSVVVEAGSYVLLVSSRAETADALVAGFAALAGDAIGEADAFFTGME